MISALLCWVTPDFELYAAFDPLADKVRYFLALNTQKQIAKCHEKLAKWDRYDIDRALLVSNDEFVWQAMAIKICNQVCQRVKDVENEVFLQGASPFSW